MPAYFPGSTTEKRLKAIARKLAGRVATEFSGITVHGHRILYRHAQFATLTVKGKEYDRWNWGNPFGRAKDWRMVDWVLLHASLPEEAFFLVPVSKAKVFAGIWPIRLNIGVEPQGSRGGREKVWVYKAPLAQVKRTLK